MTKISKAVRWDGKLRLVDGYATSDGKAIVWRNKQVWIVTALPLGLHLLFAKTLAEAMWRYEQ